MKTQEKAKELKEKTKGNLRSPITESKLSQAIECWKDEIIKLDNIFYWLAVCNKTKEVLAVANLIKEYIQDLKETIKIAEEK